MKTIILPGVVVTVVVKTPVATTEESKVVEKCIDDMIYLRGLDLPFDGRTGKKESYIPGCSVYIKELAH